MTNRKALRPTKPISYEISDASEDETLPSIPDSPFGTPQKPHRTKIGNLIDLDSEEDELAQHPKTGNFIDLDSEEDDLAQHSDPSTPPPRMSAAGHSLRQHKDLHLSLRAQENGDKPSKKRRLSKQQRKSKPTPALRKTASASALTARNEVRDEIAKKTALKRVNFFAAKSAYFLPLLPENNHIQWVLEQNPQDQDLSIPYEALENQPAGFVPCQQYLAIADIPTELRQS